MNNDTNNNNNNNLNENTSKNDNIIVGLIFGGLFIVIILVCCFNEYRIKNIELQRVRNIQQQELIERLRHEQQLNIPPPPYSNTPETNLVNESSRSERNLRFWNVNILSQ
jgi:hypothetical protein